MKHTMVTVQLHRKGVVLVAIGALFLSVLIFAGGYLAGMRRGSRPLGTDGAIPGAPSVALALPATPKSGPTTAAAVATSPNAVTAKTTVPTAEPEQLAVRAGLFTSNEEATAFAQQLTARKLNATVAASPTTSGAMLYSVYVGQYANRRAASAAVLALKRDLEIDGAIVTIQPPPLPR